MADNNPNSSQDGDYLVGVGIADVTGPASEGSSTEVAAAEPEGVQSTPEQPES
ncbi:hypothetical protein [Nocardia sp. NPDC127526]|uniref:hypothetical protein n=1 Tax=Nocardia sp. NPDC127526 TaxID=3345393 RepID=UPI00363BA7BA